MTARFSEVVSVCLPDFWANAAVMFFNPDTPALHHWEQLQFFSGATIPFNWDNFPSTINILEPVGNAAGEQTGLGGSVTFFNLHPKSPKQLRWQVGIQRELPWGFVAEATYVGNYGYDLEIVKDLNALPGQYLVDSGIR